MIIGYLGHFQFLALLTLLQEKFGEKSFERRDFDKCCEVLRIEELWKESLQWMANIKYSENNIKTENKLDCKTLFLDKWEMFFA